MSENVQCRVVNNTMMYLVSASQSNAYFEPHYSRNGPFRQIFDCPLSTWNDLTQNPFRYRGES